MRGHAEERIALAEAVICHLPAKESGDSESKINSRQLPLYRKAAGIE